MMNYHERDKEKEKKKKRKKEKIRICGDGQTNRSKDIHHASK
jgi:hypothetical protein